MSPQSQRLIGELPELPDYLHQFIDGEFRSISIFCTPSLTVPPPKAYRLPGLAMVKKRLVHHLSLELSNARIPACP
jgi:hypothetical protein